jgi:hypothetical protein
MDENSVIPASFVNGHVTIWDCPVGGEKSLVGDQPNQIQYSWGFIASRQLGYRFQPNRDSYHISAMYIEFENQSSAAALAGTAVSVSSSFPRSDSIGYYNSLSGNRDFLRIPLIIEPTSSVASGTEANLDDLPLEQQFNKLTFFAQTAGSTGVHGKAFSPAHNSKVYAVALVAAPVFSDRTKDAVFARTVLASGNQVAKTASSQIGITWDISFK